MAPQRKHRLTGLIFVLKHGTAKKSPPGPKIIEFASPDKTTFTSIPKGKRQRKQSIPAVNGITDEATEATPLPESQKPVYITVIGQTRAEETTFVRTVTGPSSKPNDGNKSRNDSVTEDSAHKLEIIETVIDDRTIKLINTPSFDDSNRSELDILEEAAGYFKEMYDSKVYLTGIIYLHRITDPMDEGLASRVLSHLDEICGPHFYGNIALTTVSWGMVSNREGEDRERSLRTKDRHWLEFAKTGATMHRHDDTKESAISIIRHLLKKTPDVLSFQRHLADHGIIAKTAAGEMLVSRLAEMLEKAKKRIEEPEKDTEREKSERTTESKPAAEFKGATKSRLKKSHSEKMANANEESRSAMKRRLGSAYI